MRVHTYITSCEVRRVFERTNKQGVTSIVLKLEDMEGDSFEASTRNESLFDEVRTLRKGDVIDIPACILATDKYQFVSIEGAPEVHDEDED